MFTSMSCWRIQINKKLKISTFNKTVACITNPTYGVRASVINIGVFVEEAMQETQQGIPTGA